MIFFSVVFFYSGPQCGSCLFVVVDSLCDGCVAVCANWDEKTRAEMSTTSAYDNRWKMAERGDSGRQTEEWVVAIVGGGWWVVAVVGSR